MGNITQTELVPTLKDNVGAPTSIKVDEGSLTLMQEDDELVFQWGDEFDDLELMARWFKELADALDRIRSIKRGVR